MTRMLCLAAVLAAGLALPALASEMMPPMGPTGTPQQPPEQTPATAKPFTRIDARNLLMQRGYTNVSELVKDETGKWVGSAMKDGKTVPVAVDVKGNVSN